MINCYFYFVCLFRIHFLLVKLLNMQFSKCTYCKIGVYVDIGIIDIYIFGEIVFLRGEGPLTGTAAKTTAVAT